MQTTVIPRGAVSYLAQLPADDLNLLAERLSPTVQLALTAHLSCSLSPSPRIGVPAPQPTNRRAHEYAPPPPSAPLLSHSELKAVLPAVAPSARRWLQETDNAARTASSQQRVLQEMGRHVVRTEQRCDTAERRAKELHHLAEQQSAALVASAARSASLREAYERQRALLQQEQQRSRELERGLRRMARERDALAEMRTAAAAGARSARDRTLPQHSYSPGATPAR